MTVICCDDRREIRDVIGCAISRNCQPQIASTIVELNCCSWLQEIRGLITGLICGCLGEEIRVYSPSYFLCAGGDLDGGLWSGGKAILNRPPPAARKNICLKPLA